MSESVLLNPAPDALHANHVIFSGTATQHQASLSEGCLSIKTVARGEATWRSRGKAFNVGPTAWLLLNAASPYELEIACDAPTTTFCVFFQDGFLSDVAANLKTQTEQSLLEQSTSSQDPDFRPGLRLRNELIDESLRRMFDAAYHSTEIDWYDTLSRLGIQLFEDRRAEGAMWERLAAAKPSTRTEIVKRVRCGMDFLVSNLSRPLSTRQIAAEACLSEFHFHRVFKTLYRQTPHAFLQEQRLKLASTLLIQSTQSITEVCYASGFQSLGSFSTLFRKRFGCTPRTYRLRGL